MNELVCLFFFLGIDVGMLIGFLLGHADKKK